VDLPKEQKRLVQLQFEKRTAEIAITAKRQLDDVTRVKLREGWAPEDPKFFVYISDCRAKFNASLLWAFVECWFEVIDASGTEIDEETAQNLRSEVSKKYSGLKETARQSLLGDPWGHLGNFETIIRRSLMSTQAEIDKEIERRYLTHRTRVVARPGNRAEKWVLSLHGIRSRGAWQKELTSQLNRVGFNCLPLDYGNFLALELLIPFLRARKIKWFLQEYTRHVQGADPRPSIVAHSFGTYIVAGALRRYPELKFDRVIFAGSIVASSFDWANYIPQQVRAVLNDSGGRDFWVWLAPWLISDAGRSGRCGFSEGANGAVLNHVRPMFGHSEHFYDLNYIRSWVPFLQNGECEGSSSPARKSKSGINWRFATTLIGLPVTILSLVICLMRFGRYISPWLGSLVHWLSPK
jgi:hypothetical protein